MDLVKIVSKRRRPCCCLDFFGMNFGVFVIKHHGIDYDLICRVLQPERRPFITWNTVFYRSKDGVPHGGDVRYQAINETTRPILFRFYSFVSFMFCIFANMKRDALRNPQYMYSDEDILKKLGIDALSDMQVKMRDAMLGSRSDVVLLSATGSGKTLAYLLPLVHILDSSSDNVQAVVIVPGRELAMQSCAVFRSMGTGLGAMCLYGGRPAMDEHRELEKMKPQIVFATPGRLVDHLGKGNFNQYSVRYVVIDEFDKCLQMGFADEMKRAFGMLPGVGRRFLLSATDAEEIPSFVNMRNVERIDYIGSDDMAQRVKLLCAKSDDKDKLEALARMLCSFGQSSTIVFLNYRDSVERTGAFLTEKGFVVSTFHGGMDQKAREAAIYKFANGSANVLVATDLASRGLDMPEVDNIVHYHLPVGEDEYIHRTGRTARWKSEGRAFFLLGPDEEIPGYVRQQVDVYDIPEGCGVPPRPRMVTLYIGKGKKDKVSRGDILGFLCKVGGLDGSDIGRIDIRERWAYVAVNSNKWKDVVKRANGAKIKGIKTIIELIK